MESGSNELQYAEDGGLHSQPRGFGREQGQGGIDDQEPTAGDSLTFPGEGGSLNGRRTGEGVGEGSTEQTGKGSADGLWAAEGWASGFWLGERFWRSRRLLYAGNGPQAVWGSGSGDEGGVGSLDTDVGLGVGMEEKCIGDCNWEMIKVVL